MKLIYILAQAHTGSTLTDCILGENKNIVSSGELRYLGWQMYRTLNESLSIEKQNICSCGQSFFTCNYWSKVLDILSNREGVDLKNDPFSLNNAFFNYFSYANQIDEIRFSDRIKARIVRYIVENNFPKSSEYLVQPKIKVWLRNNWKLYEAMAEAAGAEAVVDSSKDRRIGLLLHRMYPSKVFFIIIKRSPEGFIAAKKRWSDKNHEKYNIINAIDEYKSYMQTMNRIIRNYKLNYIEVTYEDIVSDPEFFLKDVSEQFDLAHNVDMDNKEFMIHPNELHLVAGNPMRYKGVQKIKQDKRWKDELSQDEINLIHTALK